MPKLKIEVELSEHLYRAFERDAERTRTPMEDMVARLVNGLIRDMEREEAEPPPFVC